MLRSILATPRDPDFWVRVRNFFGLKLIFLLNKVTDPIESDTDFSKILKLLSKDATWWRLSALTKI